MIWYKCHLCNKFNNFYICCWIYVKLKIIIMIMIKMDMICANQIVEWYILICILHF